MKVIKKRLKKLNLIPMEGRLRKTIVESQGTEYYVKQGLYGSNILYQASECLAYEIGKLLGFNVLKYEAWEIDASLVMDEDELEYYKEDYNRYSGEERRLKQNGRIVLSASKNFIKEKDNYFSADTILPTEELEGKELYESLISSGYFSQEFVDQMTLFDFIVHNVDRHVRNFGYIVSEDGHIEESILFDHGQSLLSDFSDNELKEHGKHLFMKNTLKPFYTWKSLKWLNKTSIQNINLSVDLYEIDLIVEKYESILGTERIKLISSLVKGRIEYARTILL